MIEFLFKMMFGDILLGPMEFVPDHFKRKEMYNEAVRNNPWALRHAPDNLKAQDMSNEAVCLRPHLLQYVPFHLRMQEICDKPVRDDSSSLQFVPDWFVTRDGVDMWHDDNYDDDGDHWNDDNDEDKFFEWYDGYQKRKAQKASIKKELMPITWHPSRYWDWCMS